MTFSALMLVLRLVHILAGVFWAGSAVMFAGFVHPAVRATGATGGRVMQQIMQHRRLSLCFSVAAALTILSGVAMYSIIGAGSYGAWMRSPMGVTLGVGAVAALIAAMLGAGVAAPAAKRLAMLGAAQNPPSPDRLAAIARAQTRLARASTLSAALLVVAVAAMATARYV